MGIEILEILLVWLTIGVVIGGWISVDTFRRKVEGARWVVAGIVLSVIGLALYLIMKKRDSNKQPEFHSAPEYRYVEPETPKAQPAPTVPQGTSAPEPASPHLEPQMTQETVPAAMPEEIKPEYRSWAPVVRDQVEGIPRCQKCGIAISSHDDFCSECGAKLK